MFMLDPGRTQFDLNFRLLGTAVRVHPMFWILSAFLGQSFFERGIEFLLLWIACVFISVLIHEMGHVLMGRLFGSDGHIVLYSFGGLAIGSNLLSSRWQRIAVLFAGPLAQLVFWGFVWLLRNRLLVGPQGGSDYLHVALDQLDWINWYWPLLNLLPIWPLDGGQITREVLVWLAPRRGIRVALGISLVTAGLLAINSLAAHSGRELIPYLPAGGLYTALFFGLLALNNLFELQQLGQERPRWEDDEPPRWDRDRDSWER